MSEWDGKCLVIHGQAIGEADIAMFDVTAGADGILDHMERGVGIAMTFHRHPERDDGLMTFVGHHFDIEVDFDWQELYQRLAERDPAWNHDWTVNDAVWSHLDPEVVWEYMVAVALFTEFVSRS